MPETRNTGRILPTPKRKSQTVGRYAELHCRSNYSFLRGASHPDELVNRAAELGLSALAITDRNSLAGVVRAHVAAAESGLKLLVGAEITPVDSMPLVLLATNRAGYANLSNLITCGSRAAAKGEFHLTFEDVASHAHGLLACIPLPASGQKEATQQIRAYQACFPDHCYGLLELHHGPNDDLRLDCMSRLARSVELPVAAANDAHYHIRERQPLQDVLTAIRLGCTVTELGRHRFANAERHLKSAVDMQRLFAAAPNAVASTLEVADRCSFSLDELRYEYPEELCPIGVTPIAYLTRLAWQGASERYLEGIPRKVGDLIHHELKLIEELQYEAYFLTVYDLVKFARKQGILCQGRGSAANSAICFCLHITEVPVDSIDVLFERFISKERNEPPDIDVDFEHNRREEVIQYVYDKYGRDRAGMTGVVIRYRPRSAIRDVGKALGFSLDHIDQLAKSVDHSTADTSTETVLSASDVPTSSSLQKHFHFLVDQLLHSPRHLSQHPGGMVITRGFLSDFVPIENATMPGRTVIQWDKADLDALGLLKVDILALGMLTAIQRCLRLINSYSEYPMTMADIPKEDPVVYEMISQADTIGVFQIESRAQMSMLPRLRPKCYYDLVIQVAIVRPGPIQGDMVHPYLKRRSGKDPVEYPDNRIRKVLQKTLGVPIFQEQAMRLVVVAAGFSPGEADQLRRAMGAWRKQGVIDKFRQQLLNGMVGNGYEAEYAERVFRQLQGFGAYGFPESHAASFALLVYVSAWLKRYHPAAFTAALLNSQPMGFYAPAQLISDSRKHGVTVLPVDVNFSDWDCTLEDLKAGEPNLRMGFRMISGFTIESANELCRCRTSALFVSFEEFQSRTQFSSAVLSRLSKADAFRSLNLDRRQALWNSLPDQTEQPLYAGQVTVDDTVRLPVLRQHGQVIADYQTTGLSLRGHPLKAYRNMLRDRGVITTDELSTHPCNRRVRIAGLVLVRQHPGSANGITFVTLEDETGTSNLIIRPDVWNRFRQVARTSAALVARGILQREQNVIHVLTDHLEDLSVAVSKAKIASRDFR
jgi:error-prone DNA polymerase